MRLLAPIWAVALVSAASLLACAPQPVPSERGRYRTTIDELLLEDARTCSSGFEYPSSLVDGIGHQLVEELRCLDDNWLESYEPCREPGCIWPDGPQPHAIRPEVIDALEEAAASIDDFISITAGYRDVAMQYYSRWYNENCDASFDAAIPGQSNHQGGRAIDVRYYDFWWDTLIEHGFEHPIPTDGPHFELVGTAAFRDESNRLQALSILAFQRLWNRNNLDDRIAEDGIYDAGTKERLGASPVEGFPIGACAPGSAGDVGVDVGDAGTDLDSGGADTGSDAGFDTEGGAGPDASAPDATHADVSDDGGSDSGGSNDTGTLADTGARVVDGSSGPRAPTMFSAAPPPAGVSARGCAAAGARPPSGFVAGLLLLGTALARRGGGRYGRGRGCRRRA